MQTAQVVRLVDLPQRTQPSLPVMISSALQCGAKTEINENSGEISITPDRRWFPPPATVEQLTDAAHALREFEVWLAPAPRDWLIERMKALFARFWVADLDAQTHSLITSDTLDAISEFPRWAIAEVCRDWIANKTVRPHAADLVRGCRERIAADTVTLHNLRRFVDPEEQHQAAPRQAERERREAERQSAYVADRAEKIAAIDARDRRFAEAAAWRAENPATGDQRLLVRPMEREPASKEKRRQVADELSTFRLPDEDAPGVLAWIRKMGAGSAEPKVDDDARQS